MSFILVQLKERQERLKSLEAQFSSKARMMSFGGSSKKSYENGSVEMLGDAKTGYVVNVVRDEGEEAVRIPPSMSAKLKSHQVHFSLLIQPLLYYPVKYNCTMISDYHISGILNVLW